jgi:hypothetical protein
VFFPVLGLQFPRFSIAANPQTNIVYSLLVMLFGKVKGFFHSTRLHRHVQIRGLVFLFEPPANVMVSVFQNVPVLSRVGAKKPSGCQSAEESNISTL